VSETQEASRAFLSTLRGDERTGVEDVARDRATLRWRDFFFAAATSASTCASSWSAANGVSLEMPCLRKYSLAA
jgi:hypothetical protein